MKVKLRFLDKYNADEVCWEDVVALHAALGAKWNYLKNAQRLKKNYENSFSWCMAFSGKKLVGIGRTLSDGAVHGWIHDIAVHPDFQRQGIGTAIMEHLIAQLKGVRYIGLLNGEGTEGFYKKFGFGSARAMAMRQKVK